MIYTIGHSTRTLDEVVAMLRAKGVDLLGDIRAYPSSRKFPQWNQVAIARHLPIDIAYHHLPGLGGRRKPLPAHESVCGAWRNPSFRGYGDYMQTAAFDSGLAELIELDQRYAVAIMCSEAVPWRCHRQLIADALLVQGIDVSHIMSLTSTKPATVHEIAVISDGHVTYPASQMNLL
jgi:uncharacterized protein (DUF488 family)